MIQQLAAAGRRFLRSMQLQARLAGLEQDIADIDEMIEYAGALSDMTPMLMFERRCIATRAQALQAELQALHSEQRTEQA